MDGATQDGAESLVPVTCVGQIQLFLPSKTLSLSISSRIRAENEGLPENASIRAE
jgi:hypothetical protein